MKKFLILSLTAVAITSQAVSFTWKSSGQVRFGDSLVSALTPNTYTATLILLGSDGAWGSTQIGVSGYTLDSKSGDSATTYTKTSNVGKTGPLAVQNSQFSGTGGGNAGDYFGVMLTYVDKDGVSWFNISSVVYQIPESANDGTAGLSQSFTFGSGTTQFELATGETKTLSSGGGWVSAIPAAVPEPSTAALALAGLALLLKRRKA